MKRNGNPNHVRKSGRVEREREREEDEWRVIPGLERGRKRREEEARSQLSSDSRR